MDRALDMEKVAKAAKWIVESTNAVALTGAGISVESGIPDFRGNDGLWTRYDPAEYATLLKPVISFNADLVMGSRLVASPCTRVSYFWHKAGNRLITFVFNILNNTTFTDVYSCYLLYRRDLVAVSDIVTDGWE